ncbi:MAG: hypothetical protein H7Y11_07745, partial [Armatimonadetes bacterium]|nr:hypothetical protein [Anaerolineae bacterium]
MTEIPTPQDNSPRPSLIGNLSWLALLLLLFGGIMAMQVLETPYSTYLLFALVIGSVVVIARDADVRAGRLISGTRQLLLAPRSTATQWFATRAQAAQGLSLVALIMMILATTLIRPTSTKESLFTGLIVMLIGAVAFAVALALDQNRAQFAQPSDAVLTPQRSQWGVTLLGATLLLFLGELNGGLTPFTRPYPDAAGKMIGSNLLTTLN